VNSASLEVSGELSHDEGQLYEAVDALCQELDIARPVWLSKHSRELILYSRTLLGESDFVEGFPYKALELEWFRSDGEKKSKE